MAKRLSDRWLVYAGKTWISSHNSENAALRAAEQTSRLHANVELVDSVSESSLVTKKQPTRYFLNGTQITNAPANAG